MVRVKRGNVARKRRKKILKLAKGYRGTHSQCRDVAIGFLYIVGLIFTEI